MDSKENLRRHFLAWRQSLSPQDRRQAAEGLCRMFVDRLPPLPPPPLCVAGYVAFRGELDVFPLLKQLEEKGFSLALPCVLAKNKPLVFRAWQTDAPLRTGAFGISEPEETQPLITPAIILVPSLALDTTGYRLGYGAGFYDRTLPLFPSALSVGITYDACHIPHILHTATDAQMHAWVTEKTAGFYAARA